MQCPVCNVTLQMADRQGIEIDYCPQCRGVWLDRGELDKIIERTTADMGPPQPGPTHDHVKGHYGGKHKKKSLLKELLDF